MMRWKRLIATVFVLWSVTLPSIVFSSNHRNEFESAEHIAAGQNIKLYFKSGDSGQYNPELHLTNGLHFTYAQLLAISGDFYGIPGKTISEGKSLDDRKSTFIAAYKTLAEDPAAVKEAPLIFAVIQKEQDAVLEGMKQGEKPEDIYSKISDDDDRQWNCITGGGCAAMWWLNAGRFLTLSKKDYDHFGGNAWSAYAAGHAVALETAIQAHQHHDISLLETAYSMDAYAGHFLSDRFSSGHIRTPRVELPGSVTPAVLGSVLVHYMHNEENQYGLHVHNAMGERWNAFGDQYFFDNQNVENRARLEAALQQSVNEIFNAYKTGILPEQGTLQSFLPEADSVGDTVSHDIAPLFYWDSDKHVVYRRVDVENVYDAHWTSDWWGWSTVMLLASKRGIPTSSQHALVAAGYGKQALQKGLITDKATIQYLKRNQ